MKKIGFDRQDEPITPVVDPLQKAIDKLKPYITALYLPVGDTKDKEFITSRELLYELQEITETNILIINKTLDQLGFTLKFIDKVPCWVMYEIPDRD